MTDKERLGSMSPIGVAMDGNVLISGEDWHWLMAQAELVQELKNEIKTHEPHGRNYTNEQVVEIRLKNESYREAIRGAIGYFNYDEHQRGMKVLQKVLE